MSIIAAYTTSSIPHGIILRSENCNPIEPYIQWGAVYKVFDTLPILQVFPFTKHVEVCHFYHRYNTTVRDGI